MLPFSLVRKIFHIFEANLCPYASRGGLAWGLIAPWAPPKTIILNDNQNWRYSYQICYALVNPLNPLAPRVHWVPVCPWLHTEIFFVTLVWILNFPVPICHAGVFLSCRCVYHLTMLAVPHLIKTTGNIVNVSSVCGTRSVSLHRNTDTDTSKFLK